MDPAPQNSDGLFAETRGPGVDPGPRQDRLVLAHGFTQNGRCWGDFGEHLTRSNEVVFVDAPGHGRSSDDQADLWTAARLLTEVGGDAIYIGYSMGGRTALHAALATPEKVKGLVLIGATAGLDGEQDRADRRAADAYLADRLLADGLPAFLERWLAGPLFAGLAPEQAGKAQRLTNRPEGLAESLRHCGTGSQESLWDRLGELAMPVLIVVGEQDQKFSAIGERLLTALTSTDAQLITVPGTHAVHLERPNRTAQAILAAIADWDR